ncbi:hypothetical protein BDQ12DRAFT_639770, partial [Crucibulum laeve]
MLNPLLLEKSILLRLLISSRPEAHIQRFFDMDPIKASCISIHLDTSLQLSDDIRSFLENGFADMLQDSDFSYALSTVPRPWPSASCMDKLVQKSFGQFLYASTVLKYVGDPDCHPVDQLTNIMEANT